MLDLRPFENNFVVDDLQKVSSAYTKTNNPVDFIRNSEVLYAEKNKTAKLLRTIGFQAPIELQQSGFIGSISYKGQNVNIDGEKFSKVFLESKEKSDIAEEKGAPIPTEIGAEYIASSTTARAASLLIPAALRT